MNLSIIELAAKDHPEVLAYDDGQTQIRYGDLRAALSSLPFSKIDLPQSKTAIAWCPRNDAESLLTFWAIELRGAVACPISHRFPIETRQQIIDRIAAHWLPDFLANRRSATPPSRPFLEGESSAATLILSSGSTGEPKAIVHSLAAHIESAHGAASNMPLSPGDRWLWSLPLCHVSGLSILIRCAVAAATVVGIPEDAGLSVDLLSKQRITHLSLVTTQLRRLMAEKSFPSPYLKAVLLGGSSVDEALVRAARQRGVPVSTTYGLSETASQVTTSTIVDDPGSSGTVLPGRELKLNPAGEVLVRGKTLCLGYYRGAQIESVLDADGWFATGDLGRLDDQGRLFVNGRIDNMFISGGENIHPESIERAMRSLFSIEDVVVVPRPDQAFGFRPVAFVRGELPADWEQQLRSRLQGYEIPQAIFALPPNEAGSIKPNRRLLRELATVL